MYDCLGVTGGADGDVNLARSVPLKPQTDDSSKSYGCCGGTETDSEIAPDIPVAGRCRDLWLVELRAATKFANEFADGFIMFRVSLVNSSDGECDVKYGDGH